MADLGGALLSGIIGVLCDRLASKEFLDLFRGKEPILNPLELKIRLLSANALLNDAEDKQLKDQYVRMWLEELKEVLYEADRVMDKINTEALRIKLEEAESSGEAMKFRKLEKGESSRGNTGKSEIDENTVKSEIEEILTTLRHLLDQTEFLGLKKIDKRTPSYRSDAPLVEESDVFGREDDKEAVVELLLSDDDVGGNRHISVIPIVGMGGIGKTTLAQLVCDDSRVKQHFDLPPVWVTVSDDFDVFRITRAIFEGIPSKKCQTENLHQLQKELKEALTGKKFLFVLDDIWNENYDLWDALKSPFKSEAHGSKIIVTTRNKSIAGKMASNVQTYELGLIDEDECWKLFVKHVFSDLGSEVQSELQEIGNQIVKKCKGLPLAVKSMAGLLRSVTDPVEWRSVLESDIWELQNTNIVPALWLSYQFLPPRLKRCFSHLSMFPKDYQFKKEDREKLILVWMADGLLQPQKGKRIEDVGEEYFNTLISRSFFQRPGLNESAFSMHDLIHDLAMCVSGEFCFLNDSRNDLSNLTSKTHYLSYNKKFREEIEYEDLSIAKYLRSLIALPLSYDCVDSSQRVLIENVLQELLLGAGGCLRTLSLSESSITELPAAIGKLKHLRYLDVSGTEVEEIPSSICELYNLETLLLSYCEELKQLPETIGKLKHLRYLDVSGTEVEEIPSSICELYNLETLLLSYCEELKQLPTNISKLINLRHLMIEGTPLGEMPPLMCNLTNLQRLSNFVLSKNDGFRIKELGELQHLHGSLCISGLENVKEVRDVLGSKYLKNKKHLSELILEWEGESDDSEKEREILDALQPPVNLKQLQIKGYKGTRFPDWVSDPSYCNLEKVSLTKLENCCLVPSFKQLRSLRKLKIKTSNGSPSINDEFYGVCSTRSFQSLVRLKLDGINMTEWSFISGGDIFPDLKYIYLRGCRELNVGLPAGNFPSLETIVIEVCEDMVAVFPTSSPHIIDATYPSLEYLIIRDCSRVESFSRMGMGMGLPSTLEHLYIHHCKMLWENRMNWNLQRLSWPVELYVMVDDYEEMVDSFPEEGLLPTTLWALSIEGFKYLKALNGKGFQHLTSLQQLTLRYLDKLECLPEEGLPHTLTSLNIHKCPLLIPRCQRGTGEDWPNIQHIPRIQIDWERI